MKHTSEITLIGVCLYMLVKGCGILMNSRDLYKVYKACCIGAFDYDDDLWYRHALECALGVYGYLHAYYDARIQYLAMFC